MHEDAKLMSVRWVGSVIAMLVCVASAQPIHGEDSPSASPPFDGLASPSRDVPEDWLTHAERSGFRTTPRYDETVAFCKRLAGASEWIRYDTFGTSGEGRELPLLIASKLGRFDAAAAHASGDLIVLVQNCIHAGECAGKDASLMLLRDLAITRTRAALLDHVVLLVIPIFSADGHERFGPFSRINQNGPDEMGWRTTSRNLNLNRDYMKADAVEMRAWLRLWNAWQPDLHFDHHTTDGGDWQYDVQYAVDDHAAAAPSVARWLTNEWELHVIAGLRRDGHLPMRYFSLVDSKDPAKGTRSGGFGPRYSTGYAAIRNRPSILVETHMLKDYRRRVIGHYNIMVHTLELLNRDPGALRTAVEEADRETVRAGRADGDPRTFPLTLRGTDEPRRMTFKGFASRREASDVSGDTRVIYDSTSPIDIEVDWRSGLEVDRTIDPPLAYIVPVQWSELIDLLELHGLRCERLTEATTVDVESYRFEDVTFAERPYEGRFRTNVTSHRITECRTFSPGSVVVSLDQPNAKVAIHLLERTRPTPCCRGACFTRSSSGRSMASTTSSRSSRER